jgi:HPt (histidine-containing phosphotransfer) domain-containing protein
MPQNVIDADHIQYLHSIGDISFVAEMVESFFADAAESIGYMETAIAAKEAGQFRFAAHGMKSCSYNVGANQLAALCAKFEKITESDFHENGGKHLSLVKQALSAAEAELSVIALAKESFTPAVASSG